MYQFFMEGGWSMYPILVLGLILVWSAARFAIDREPVRRSFIGVTSLALLVSLVQGSLSGFGVLMWALSDVKRVPPEMRLPILFAGLKEVTRPGIFGLGFLGVGLILLAIGVYRTGLRELRATQA